MDIKIMKTIIAGDIHGDFGALNALISRLRPDLLICCGDFGFWPNFKLPEIKPQSTKILFCDGNHEDHWALRDLENTEIQPNVFYMKRGSTYELPDGRNILFMGGAESIDKNLRTLGHDWFPEEEISQKDFVNLPDKKIDIFITHTCPAHLVDILCREYPDKKCESSNTALTALWEIYKPNLWYFGHYHQFKFGSFNNTKWFCLSYPHEGNRWWIPLHKKNE